MSEAVNHPPHYGGDTTYEAIKVIEAWQLGFRLGNVLKYIRRTGDKGDRIQNLQKARWYLDREIAAVERDEANERIANERTSDPKPAARFPSTTPDEFTEFKS
jgi:hypothetical protein